MLSEQFSVIVNWMAVMSVYQQRDIKWLYFHRFLLQLPLYITEIKFESHLFAECTCNQYNTNNRKFAKYTPVWAMHLKNRGWKG